MLWYFIMDMHSWCIFHYLIFESWLSFMICLDFCLQVTHTHIHTHTHTHTQSLMHNNIYIHTHTYIHMLAHTFIHSYTHSLHTLIHLHWFSITGFWFNWYHFVIVRLFFFISWHDIAMLCFIDDTKYFILFRLIIVFLETIVCRDRLYFWYLALSDIEKHSWNVLLTLFTWYVGSHSLIYIKTLRYCYKHEMNVIFVFISF